MLTIVTDRGVKDRAMKVMRASGMTPTGVVRLMCSEGLVQWRLPSRSLASHRAQGSA